jgi:hypothetical protein
MKIKNVENTEKISKEKLIFFSHGIQKEINKKNLYFLIILMRKILDSKNVSFSKLKHFYFALPKKQKIS